MRKIAFLGDVQWPYQHDGAMKAIMDYLKRAKPDELWFMGDGIDLTQLAIKHPKQPGGELWLQGEIDGWVKVLASWAALVPGRKVYLGGNHEHRLQMYLWTQAPKLSGLSGLKVEKLLKLDELGYGWHPYREMVQVAKHFFATHGDVVRAHSGFTAKVMLDKTGSNGIMGHTHRLGSSLRRVMSGSTGTDKLTGWWENGCLCDYRKMDWTSTPEDWHVGFSIGTFFGPEDGKKLDGYFAVQQVVITKDFFVHGDELYGG